MNSFEFATLFDRFIGASCVRLALHSYPDTRNQFSMFDYTSSFLPVPVVTFCRPVVAAKQNCVMTGKMRRRGGSGIKKTKKMTVGHQNESAKKAQHTSTATDASFAVLGISFNGMTSGSERGLCDHRTSLVHDDEDLKLKDFYHTIREYL